MPKPRDPSFLSQPSPARGTPGRKKVGDPAHDFIQRMQEIMEERQWMKERITKLRANRGSFAIRSKNEMKSDPDIPEQCIKGQYGPLRNLESSVVARIINGNYLPNEDELCRFALSYGLAGKQCADFVKQGLKYTEECTKRQTPVAVEKTAAEASVPKVLTENASLSEVLNYLIKLRKVYDDTKQIVDPSNPRRVRTRDLSQTILKHWYGVSQKACELISGQRPHAGNNFSSSVPNDINDYLPFMLGAMKATPEEEARVYSAYLQALLKCDVPMDDPVLKLVAEKLESTERPAQGPHTAALANQKSGNVRSL